MMQQVATAATTTEKAKYRNPHFDDPQVRAYTAKLRERINNLADKGDKSLLTTDALEYCVKPACRAALEANSNPQLAALYAGGPKRNEVQYGHPFYSWFLHAAASQCVTQFIDGNADDIFGTGALRQKVNEGVAKVRQNGGDIANYVKRTFSRPIKTAYVSKRPDIIQNTWVRLSPQILAQPSIQQLLQLALSAKQAGAKSVGAYKRGQGGMRGGMTASFAAPPPSFTTATPTLTPSAPSTSSSSSSSSMPPQPFGMSTLLSNQ